MIRGGLTYWDHRFGPAPSVKELVDALIDPITLPTVLTPKQVEVNRRRRVNREAALSRLEQRAHANEHVSTVAVTRYSTGGDPLNR